MSTRALEQLETVGWAQADIDEFYDPPEPKFAARVSLECMMLAVEQARRSIPDVDGICVIPLDYSTTGLQTDFPSLDQILGQPWTYGPGRSVPGISLCMPAMWRHYDDSERYVRQAPSESFPRSRYAAYYSCWRSDSDDVGEYARGLYIRTL